MIDVIMPAYLPTKGHHDMLLRAIKSLEKQTVSFITHRLATIKDADLIVLMDKGNIAEIGNHDFLINKKGKYFDLYSQQEN